MIAVKLQPIQVLSYPQFLKELKRYDAQKEDYVWAQGEHLTVMGPTGCGKTWICRDVVNLRKYVVVFCAKSKDKTILRYEGYKILDEWRDRYYRDQHVILWPRNRTLDEAKENVRPRIKEALDSIYVEGGWTAQLDDLNYLCNELGLKRDIQTMYGQVRANDTSLVGCGQSPFGIVQYALNQASHWLMFHMADGRNADRMAEVCGLAPKQVERANGELVGRDFLWFQPMKEPIRVRRS